MADTKRAESSKHSEIFDSDEIQILRYVDNESSQMRGLSENRKSVNANKNVYITKSYDDFRVPHPKGGEGNAYYTNDKEDAINTASAMWKDHHTPVSFKIKSVQEHPSS